MVAFLASFFERYVEYDFTAQLEAQLDDISGGRIDWKAVLGDFWKAFSAAINDTKELRVSAVIDALDADLGPHFFPQDPEKPDVDPRLCPACGKGRLGLRLGRTGGFIGCSGYPECRYTRRLAVPSADGEDGDLDLSSPRKLGSDPQSSLEVTLRKGPYGIYIQLGEPVEKEKPKRVSLPKGMAPDTVTLEIALGLLALPREIGNHPESGKTIVAGIGRFGPYVKHENTYRSLTEGDDVLTVGLNRAVALLAEAGPRRGGSPAVSSAPIPEDGKVVAQGKGRFGPYVKHGRLFASIPASMDPESITLEEALPLLAAQAEKKAKKAPAKKTAAKRHSQEEHGEEISREKDRRQESSGQGKTAAGKTAKKKTCDQGCNLIAPVHRPRCDSAP